MSKVNLLKQSFSPSVHMMQHTGVGGRGADHHKSSAEGKACLIPRRRTMDIKAASRVGSGRAHPGPLAPDYIMHGSVVCCSDRSDLSLGENLCVFRSAKFCSDPGRSAKFTADIQDLNISYLMLPNIKHVRMFWISAKERGKQAGAPQRVWEIFFFELRAAGET